jgi:GNAT superfamily N-acetyltransferase
MAAPPPAGAGPVVASPGVEQPAPQIAAAADVSRLADVLADAFLDDPVYTWMLPGTLRPRARLRAMFTAEMEHYGLPQGTIWTSSGYDGAAVELSPGAWEMPMSMTGKEALTWLRAFGRRMTLAARVQRALQARHPREPHFYLRIVGVRTARQGQGMGSALMQATLQRADAAGLPAYIEASSQRSASLYQRLGFVHTGVLELPDGGPPVWPMRRPPSASAQHLRTGKPRGGIPGDAGNRPGSQSIPGFGNR